MGFLPRQCSLSSILDAREVNRITKSQGHPSLNVNRMIHRGPCDFDKCGLYRGPVFASVIYSVYKDAS